MMSPRSSKSSNPMQSKRASGLSRSQPNTSRSDQPQRIASDAQRSRNDPAASMIRCQRSGEKPDGGGIEDSAAKPSAQRLGTLAPYSMIAARSSGSSALPGNERNELNELSPSSGRLRGDSWFRGGVISFVSFISYCGRALRDRARKVSNGLLTPHLPRRQSRFPEASRLRCRRG